MNNEHASGYSGTSMTRSEVGHAPEDARDANELVALAIQQKVPVEVLERLVALQERVSERNARGAYFQALANFQNECPQIAKSKTVDFATASGARTNYTYAPLEEITRVVRPILSAHGLSYSWTAEVGAQPGVLDVVCVLRHIDGHSETSRFPVPTETNAKMSGAQKNGAALTYGRRQSLIAVLGLTTADPDTDGRDTPDLEPITDEQARTLLDRIVATGSNMERFCKFLNVAKVEDIRATDYDKAVRALDRKAAAR
jgi:hypothetical protein